LGDNSAEDPRKPPEIEPLIRRTPVGRYLRFPWSAQRDGQTIRSQMLYPLSYERTIRQYTAVGTLTVRDADAR